MLRCVFASVQCFREGMFCYIGGRLLQFIGGACCEADSRPRILCALNLPCNRAELGFSFVLLLGALSTSVSPPLHCDGGQLGKLDASRCDHGSVG